MKYRIVLCALWAFLSARNKEFHEGLKQTPQQLVSFIQAFIREINDIKECLPTICTVEKHWCPSKNLTAKINSDACYKKHTNKFLPSTFAAEVIACRK